MTAAIGYNPTDLFSSFNTARFVGAIGNEDPMSSSASLQSGRRPTVINQTRELYLHPSQIFAQDSAGTAYNDISGYFSSTLNVNGVNGSTSNGTSGIESAIALPPMLTLEEIMQPHVFAKQDGTAHGNLAGNFSMPFAPKSPGSLSNIESALPLDTSATSFFAGFSDVPVSVNLTICHQTSLVPSRLTSRVAVNSLSPNRHGMLVARNWGCKEVGIF